MKLKKRLKIVSLNNNYKILINGKFASYDGKKEILLPYKNLIMKIFEEIPALNRNVLFYENRFLHDHQKYLK